MRVSIVHTLIYFFKVIKDEQLSSTLYDTRNDFRFFIPDFPMLGNNTTVSPQKASGHLSNSRVWYCCLVRHYALVR